MDHRLGAVIPLLITANELFPAGHPAEGALYDLTLLQNVEGGLLFCAADDLEEEVLVGRNMYKSGAVIG